jgi:NADPH:quinone reductase-like Zn-dependent oxidoreductase
VEQLKVGDAVFGLAPGCFGPAVVLPAGLMVLMPPGITFVEAATLPTVFVTVYAAFGARGLGPDDKVNLSLSLRLIV